MGRDEICEWLPARLELGLSDARHVIISAQMSTVVNDL